MPYAAAARPRDFRHGTTWTSALREHPVDEQLEIGLREARIGRHRHLTPCALAAIFDLLRKFRRRRSIHLVASRHLTEPRTDDPAIDRMTAEAGVAIEELRHRVGRLRGGRL